MRCLSKCRQNDKYFICVIACIFDFLSFYLYESNFNTCNLMIDRVLNTYAQKMEQYLGSFFHQPEGLVEVASIGNQNADEPGKLIISLLSLERESVQGMADTVKMGMGNSYGVSLPPVYMNMHIVIAAIYPGKRYEESLFVISQAIAFVQANPYFTLQPDTKYTVELMNTSWQDLSNIWSGMGGRYYPSVICKIRRLAFSAGEINRTMTDFRNADTTLG